MSQFKEGQRVLIKKGHWSGRLGTIHRQDKYGLRGASWRVAVDGCSRKQCIAGHAMVDASNLPAAKK